MLDVVNEVGVVGGVGGGVCEGGVFLGEDY